MFAVIPKQMYWLEPSYIYIYIVLFILFFLTWISLFVDVKMKTLARRSRLFVN